MIWNLPGSNRRPKVCVENTAGGLYLRDLFTSSWPGKKSTPGPLDKPRGQQLLTWLL